MSITQMSLKEAHDVINRLPKYILSWIVILLAAAVLWMARNWWKDYTQRGNSILVKVDTLINFAKDNRRLIIDNATTIKTQTFILKAMKEDMSILKVGQIEAKQKLKVVSEDNREWKWRFQQIEETGQVYQNNLNPREDVNDLIAVIPTKQITLDSDNEQILVMRPKPPDAHSKFYFIIKKLLGNE